MVLFEKLTDVVLLFIWNFLTQAPHKINVPSIVFQEPEVSEQISSSIPLEGPLAIFILMELQGQTIRDNMNVSFLVIILLFKVLLLIRRHESK